MERVTSFTKVQDAAAGTPTSLTSQLSTSSAASEEEDVPLIEETIQDNQDKDRLHLKIQKKKNYKGRPKDKISRCCLCSLFSMCVLSITALLAAALCLWLGVANISYYNSSQRIFATKETVVIVTEFSDSLDLSTSSVHECPTKDDFPHTNELFIIPKDQLRHSFRNCSEKHGPLNQTDSQCTLNLLSDHFYLLSGSTINFSICLTSLEEDDAPSGTLVLFDNNEAFSKYRQNGDCDNIKDARFHHNIFIGNNGHFTCTNIAYTSTNHGYHYIIANTPGNIKFYYEYSYMQYFLNREDFPDSPKCSFNANGDNYCNLGGVSKTPVILAVYVEEDDLANSYTTHVCLTTAWNTVLIGVLVGLCVVCIGCCCPALFLSVYLCRQCRRCLGRK